MREYLQIANHASKLSDICWSIASGRSESSAHQKTLIEQSQELFAYLNSSPDFSKRLKFSEHPTGLVDSFEGIALALEFEERFLSPDYNPQHFKRILLARKTGLESLDSVADRLACVEDPVQFDGVSTALAYIFRKWQKLAYSVYRGNNTAFFNQLAFKTHERFERRRQTPASFTQSA